MRAFIINILLMLAIVVPGYFVIRSVSNQEHLLKNNYLATIIDKHHRAQQISEPKIILAGGSNLAFGMDSKKLEDEFSVPVVNMGLHAGLGADFIINELKHTIGHGDLVLLSLEYFLADGLFDLQERTSKVYPEASNYYERRLVPLVASDIKRTRSHLELFLNPSLIDTSFTVYSREAFNEYGDIVGHLELPSSENLKFRETFNYHHWSGIELINEFDRYARSKNCTTYFLFPNYPKSEFQKNKKVISMLQEDLLENLSVEILNQPEDFVFDDSLFFDTIHHLNAVGRKIRTEKLVELLKESASAQQKIASMRP